MSEVDIYKGIAKKQEIIDYIAELEMKIDKAIKFIDIYIKTANCLNTDYDINMTIVKDILNGEDNE